MHKTRTDRQREAIERQSQRDNRSDWQQLAVLKNRPGRAIKETLKLAIRVRTKGLQ